MRLKFIFLTSLIFSVFLINVPAEVANYYLESNSYSKNYDYKPDDGRAPNYKHFTKEAMPWDFFGDWVIPERFVIATASSDRWDGIGKWRDSKVQAEFEIIDFYDRGKPAQDYQLENTWHEPWNEDKIFPEWAKRKTWHETYENAFGISGYPYYIDGDGNLESTKNIKDPSGGHFNLTSRTPMRGIIPFWEYTNKFNEYVLSITDNGSTDAPELGYDENYSEFINTYVGSSEQTNSPFYKYLENPELIEEKFNLEDPFWMLPSDYQLIRDEWLNKDGTLTNAFISIDYNNWTAYGLMSYLSDFMIWNWNTNIQENKVINKWDFPKLEPKQISVHVAGRKYSGFHIEIATDEEKNKTLADVDIWDLMFSFAGNNLENVADNDLDETLSFYYSKNESIESKIERDYFPSYRWEYSESSYIGYNSHQYRQFNPLEKQMNAYDIEKTDIKTVSKSSFDKFIQESKDKYYIETEFKSFKNDFEDWLINSRDGINSEFIKYYDTNHVGYYSNLSEDGTKFLGRNRFQSGFYPVEDIRIDDLNIAYTDQEGNAISDNTLLGDIESINIDISPNTSSEAVNILFNLPTDTQETLHFDTSRLVSINPAIPPTPDNNNGLSPMTIGLIVGIAGAVILIGAVIVIGVVKKK